MGWIILEGLDRSGKSSVADLYATKHGYEIYHMGAPDKKFFDPNYIGPSYLDECVDVYMALSGKDVIFDRSVYGELVWPEVYVRTPQLSFDDIDVLREIEDTNDCQRIWMQPSDTEAHWNRCLSDKEPLTRSQFNKAYAYFERLENSCGFVKRELSDFSEGIKEMSFNKEKKKEIKLNSTTAKKVEIAKSITDQQVKLEKANAINSLLSSRIIKKKGELYDLIENDVRSFLQERLNAIFNNSLDGSSFSNDEVQILKLYVQRIKEKLGDKK